MGAVSCHVSRAATITFHLFSIYLKDLLWFFWGIEGVLIAKMYVEIHNLVFIIVRISLVFSHLDISCLYQQSEQVHVDDVCHVTFSSFYGSPGCTNQTVALECHLFFTFLAATMGSPTQGSHSKFKINKTNTLSNF